jgi:hypothetical protein
MIYIAFRSFLAKVAMRRIAWCKVPEWHLMVIMKGCHCFTCSTLQWDRNPHERAVTAGSEVEGQDREVIWKLAYSLSKEKVPSLREALRQFPHP